METTIHLAEGAWSLVGPASKLPVPLFSAPTNPTPRMPRPTPPSCSLHAIRVLVLTTDVPGRNAKSIAAKSLAGGVGRGAFGQPASILKNIYPVVCGNRNSC